MKEHRAAATSKQHFADRAGRIYCENELGVHEVPKITDQAEKQKIAEYLKFLGEIVTPKSGAAEIRSSARKLAEHHSSFFISDKLSVIDVNFFFAVYLLAAKMPPYVVLRIPELIDIAMHNHQYFKSLDQIQDRTLLLWGGFHENKSSNLTDYVLEAFDVRSRLGGHTCLALHSKRHTDLEEKIEANPEYSCIRLGAASPEKGKVDAEKPRRKARP